MKYSILIIAVFVMVTAFVLKSPSADFNEDVAGGIQFQKNNFSEALKLAKKEHKLIFVDIYATWCGPCKRLKATTFSNVEVGSFYNSTFINVALDGEQGEGMTLAQKYGVRSYPTLLFLDGNGDIVTRTGGYHNTEEFIELGKTINSKTNETKNK